MVDLIIPHVLNQVHYPGAGDIDDCVPVATIMAYSAEPGHKPLPDIPTFRRAAGVPDRPGPTGMTSAQAAKGARALWPELRIVDATYTWPVFGHAMEVGRRPASVSVDSSALPAGLRFGFMGLHQVAVFVQDGQWYIANPLAPGGSAPLPISAHDLHVAVGKFAGGGNVAAVLFPIVPEAGPSLPELVALVATLRAQLATAEARLLEAKRLAGLAANA